MKSRTLAALVLLGLLTAGNTACASDIPTYFDYRLTNPTASSSAVTTAIIPAIRDQGLYNTCWSFTTICSLETSLNLKLRDTLLKMKPGTRIVSHAFTMGEWEPERTVSTDDATGYFWIVPAQVAGRWAFEVGQDRFAAELGQEFQKLSVARGGPIRDGSVKGTTVHLTRANGQQLVGEVSGNQIVGRGWVATRIKSAG